MNFQPSLYKVEITTPDGRTPWDYRFDDYFEAQKTYLGFVTFSRSFQDAYIMQGVRRDKSQTFTGKNFAWKILAHNRLEDVQ